MNIVINPGRETWAELLARPAIDMEQLYGTVQGIAEAVKAQGDAAVLRFAEQFDGVRLQGLSVTEEEMRAAASEVDDTLKAAIRLAKRNIEAFHAAQRFTPVEVETMPGVRCIQKAVPIERVGLYVPGGTAPLFSTVLMLAIPAILAGCGEVVLCTPPDKRGSVHPAILFAAHEAGVHKVFKAGGAQAIAALAYGTQTIPAVHKIFGPGNRYVTAAKQWVSLHTRVSIDMPAGPSEVEVLADASANPVFVAADLLSQAEHGADSQAVLISTSAELLPAVEQEIARQLPLLARRDVAERALSHSTLVAVPSMDEALEMTNLYAPEHLIIHTRDYARVADRVVNAGSVFLGPYAPESAGDYASGTNHTLPTGGHAKACGGVCLDSFLRKITFQEITRAGLQAIGPAIETMAAAEQLDAHRRAVTLRLAAQTTDA